MKKLRGLILLVLLCAINLNSFGQGIVNHWETIVYAGEKWQYLPGSAEIPTTWKDNGFDDQSWESGNGGIGYEDGDDITVIPPTISLFMRLEFNIVDLTKISTLRLYADYDDSFIAYLNGVEIARANIGSPGENTPFDALADGNHEAVMYQGGTPEEFPVDAGILSSVLIDGTNTLAIEVHNQSPGSSDLSAIFFLIAGIEGDQRDYKVTPDWFFEPFLSSNLPLMIIETTGQTINSGSKIPADMKLIDYSPARRNYLVDSPNKYDGKISIKIRGSSSQMFPKKNYSFETQTDTGTNNNVSLLGMPTENDWVLHGPYSDKTLIRNVLSYHISASTGEYAPRTRWCELFINSQYAGVYVLTEKIKQDKNRVNIAKLLPEDISGDELTGGYIFQIDRDDSEPDDGWYSAYSSNIFYAYADPAYDELVPVQKSYIQNFISNFEDELRYAVSPDEWLPYINVYSFADYWITSEICKHIDGWKLSFYMYKDKDSDGGRLCFGPAWDYNLAFGNYDFGSLSPTPEGYSYTMAATSSNRPFWLIDFLKADTIKNCIACKWENLRAGALDTDVLMQFIDENLSHIEEARIRNFDRWPVLGIYVWPNYYVGADYADEVLYLKEWLSGRLEWMDENMVGYCAPTSSELLQFDSEINVFPNPFREKVKFSFGHEAVNLRIEIYNISGILIRIDEAEYARGMEMDLHDLDPGIYFYRISSANGVYGSGKIVKK